MPEVIGLPWGQCIGVDGFDIGEGHQAQHLELGLRSCFFGKGANGFGVENVAAHSHRHFQVIADEPPYQIALFGIQFQPGKQAIGQLHTLHRMVAAAAGLPRVVHEYREEEEVEAIDLREQGRKAPFPGKLRLAQGVNIVDDQKGMLVDGVAMIGVANDQRVNAVELGNKQFQDAECVHGAQRVRGVRSEQDLAQTVPQEWTFGDVHIEHRESVGQAVFGILRQPVAVRRDQREDAKNSLRAGEQRGFGDIDAPVLHHEVGSRNREHVCAVAAGRKTAVPAASPP